MNEIISNFYAVAVALIILSAMKIKKAVKRKNMCETEKAYTALMEEIAACESITKLMSYQSKIDRFMDHDSWKAKDGCEMVDSLQEYYNVVYDNMVYEQYSY